MSNRPGYLRMTPETWGDAKLHGLSAEQIAQAAREMEEAGAVRVVWGDDGLPVEIVAVNRPSERGHARHRRGRR